MVLCEDMIGESFLLPTDIRKEIPNDHVYCKTLWIVLILVMLIQNTEILPVKKLSYCNASSYNFSGCLLFYLQ